MATAAMRQATAASAADADRYKHKYAIATAVTLAATLELVDTSIVNVAIPHMMGNLGATLDETERNGLYGQEQRMLARDAVNGFLFQLAKIGVWKKDLVGLWENSPTPSVNLAGVYWK